jgi:pyridoxal phosphate enzyme (YggS family)
MSDLEVISRNYEKITKEILLASVNRIPQKKVTLIAVGKKQPVEALEHLYRLGHRDFGENYVQELVSKAIELAKRGCLDIRWHFIGHLQTNKIKALVPWVSSIHTVDSYRLAQAISKSWVLFGNRTFKLPVFIEVNLDSEESKSGVSPKELPELCTKIQEFQELDIQGFMCVPPIHADAGDRFRELAELGTALIS